MSELVWQFVNVLTGRTRMCYTYTRNTKLGVFSECSLCHVSLKCKIMI